MLPSGVTLLDPSLPPGFHYSRKVEIDKIYTKYYESEWETVLGPLQWCTDGDIGCLLAASGSGGQNIEEGLW